MSDDQVEGAFRVGDWQTVARLALRVQPFEGGLAVTVPSSAIQKSAVGSQTRRIALVDEQGKLIGYLPVYDA